MLASLGWRCCGMGMRVRWALLLGIGMSLFAPRCVAQNRSEARVEKDIVYGNEGGENQTLDLYLPAQAGETRWPGVVFVHGGGWSGGDKSDYSGMARELAQNGYVAISVNYRLSPKHRFPAAIVDVRRSVRWLRANADKYHVDPGRIAAMGASAGGHLVGMLGMTPNAAFDPGDTTSPRVACVVDYFGRMDLTMPQGGHDYRADFIGRSPADGLDLYRAASPITYVTKDTAPFLIVHGARDPQVAVEQSYKMMAALDKAGVEATLIVLAGQGHGFSGAPADSAWHAARAFLDAHLKK